MPEEQPLALRIIHAHVPPNLADEATEVLGELSSETWTNEGGRYGVVVSAVIGAGRSGEAMDELHRRINDRGALLVLVQPLDGVLPRPHASDFSTDRAKTRSAAAVSREEVYASLADVASIDRPYLLFVLLASIVAAIGMSTDNTAAVIGAMVLAPLLGPNMALALGMVLGDRSLIRRSLLTALVGVVLSFASAALLGLALDANPATPELAARARVTEWDLLLALAAGCAGALSYSTGAPTYLTGVMAAVALLPPTVASGLFAARAEVHQASMALLLLAGNVTALTLAAMLTFTWRGMRPRNWWQEDQARRSRRLGSAIFIVLFAILAAVILVTERFFRG